MTTYLGIQVNLQFIKMVSLLKNTNVNIFRNLFRRETELIAGARNEIRRSQSLFDALFLKMVIIKS